VKSLHIQGVISSARQCWPYVVPRDLYGLGNLIGSSNCEQSKNSDFVELKGIMKHLVKIVLERHIIIIVICERLSSFSSIFCTSHVSQSSQLSPPFAQ